MPGLNYNVLNYDVGCGIRARKSRLHIYHTPAALETSRSGLKQPILLPTAQKAACMHACHKLLLARHIQSMHAGKQKGQAKAAFKAVFNDKL